MEMSENKVVTILFERNLLKKTDSTIIYSFIPLEIVRGKEMNFDGNKFIIVTTKGVTSLKGVPNNNYDEATKHYEFSFMEDNSTLDEKYVYGFPIILNSNKEHNKSAYDIMRRDFESIRNIPMIQIIDTNLYNSKVFINLNDCNINIKADNYYELSDVLYNDFYGQKESLNDLMERTRKKVTYHTNSSSYIYSDEIFDKVSKTVICQDEAIKQIATAIAKNSRLNDPTLKSNLLVCGPTGVGKTEIFRSISENFDIPISLEDSNEYTAASFKGKDVEEILIHLIQNANGDIEKAQRGLVIIDEIDKKISKSSEHETYTTAVLNSFLKMIEGHVYKLNSNKGIVSFDTSLLTFAFSGAFSGIENLSNKKTGIGFVSPEREAESKIITNIYNDDTLKKFGLLPEFVGRCDTIVPLNDLGVDELAQIIKTSNKSQLLLYKYLFENMGIDFIYDEDTVYAIAQKAKDLGLGARSIKKIVENSLKVINFNVFARNNYSKLIISPETIEDNTQYILK